MIRKGVVFILTDYIDEVFEHISSNLHITHRTRRSAINQEKHIMVNDYQIIIKHNLNESARGYKPEFSYIIGDIKIPMVSEKFNYLQYLSHMSTRQEPIRNIASIEEIDIKEFLDDSYAETNYCNQDRLDWWNERMGGIK